MKGKPRANYYLFQPLANGALATLPAPYEPLPAAYEPLPAPYELLPEDITDCRSLCQEPDHRCQDERIERHYLDWLERRQYERAYDVNAFSVKEVTMLRKRCFCPTRRIAYLDHDNCSPC